MVMKRSSNSRVWKPARTRMAIWLSACLSRCSASISSPTVRASSSPSHTPRSEIALAFLQLGPQRLAEPALVVGDQVRGGGQDVRRRAVVALQPDDGGAGKILLEAQDVADLGAAPAIDRLVVVADAADVLRALGQQPQPEILRHVGVLVLVDQDVAEAAVILRQDVGMGLPQRHAVHDQVAEIDGVHLGQPLLVLAVDARRPCRWRTRRRRRPTPCRASARDPSSAG